MMEQVDNCDRIGVYCDKNVVHRKGKWIFEMMQFNTVIEQRIIITG